MERIVVSAIKSNIFYGNTKRHSLSKKEQQMTLEKTLQNLKSSNTFWPLTSYFSVQTDFKIKPL